MKRAFFAAVAASLVGVLVLPPIVAAQTSELIPRKMIFGNPSRLMPKVSPDGNSLAWIAPRDGVLNVWVAPSWRDRRGEAGDQRAAPSGARVLVVAGRQANSLHAGPRR